MKKKILVLTDDTCFLLEREKTFFRRDNFELRTAHTGVEVLEIVASVCPDVIFLDLDMPKMNGDECCRKLKADEKTRHVPVVVVSASGRKDAMERCRQSGCDDILLKPINSELFIDTANKHLHIQARAHPRYMARMRIHYGTEPDQLLTDYTLNLSTGGVYLKTMSLMEEGAPLTVEFVLPHRNIPLSCSACVAWVNPPEKIKSLELPVGMGIQFLGLSMESIESIRTFIHEEKLSPVW